MKRSAKLTRVGEIYTRDGRQCWWCGRTLLPIDRIPYLPLGRVPVDYPTLDHLTPKSFGGRNMLSNLVVACQPCNNRRGNELAKRIPRPGVEVVHSTKCPDCEDGVWKRTDHRLCPTCQGAGELSAERATALFITQRKKASNVEHDRAHARAEVARLRDIVENQLGRGSTRRDLAGALARQSETIRRMADRIITLKVELAEATGADLDRLLPFPKERRRALELIQGGKEPA